MIGEICCRKTGWKQVMLDPGDPVSCVNDRRSLPDHFGLSVQVSGRRLQVYGGQVLEKTGVLIHQPLPRQGALRSLPSVENHA